MGKPRYWTDEKNKELDRLIVEGCTAVEVAKKMGKTVSVIRDQARKIRRPFYTQGQRRSPSYLIREV